MKIIKMLKKNIKEIVAFMLGVLLTSGIGVYTYAHLASDISYTRNDSTTTVSNALNELYAKVPSGSMDITSNGEHNVASVANANVNVSGSGSQNYSTTEQEVGT